MQVLLEIRENLRNFYSKYEVYLTPLLKFILAVITFAMINSALGYMSILNNFLIVLVVALMCSFLPVNFIVLLGAVFIVLHMYKLSLECAIVSGALFLLLFLLYFRFAPRDTLLVLLLPLAFIMKIPFVVVLAAGLIGTPFSMISISCGVIVYYMVSYVQVNATALNSLEGDNAVGKLRYLIDGLFSNKAMLVTIAAFALTVLLVYIIRRMSIDHAWTIAMAIGTVTCVVLLLLGELVLDTSPSILSLILGAIISFILAKALQFFVFNVDYTRTEYVQFEDDEYYYYVKAVPKNSLSKTNKTVKKITSVL